MYAHAMIVPAPLDPRGSRQMLPILRQMPISDLALPGDHPFIILRNGAPVLRQDWDDLIERDDIYAIIVLPQGGGGGGSNPLRIVAMLAVIILAPQFGVLAGEWAVGAGIAETVGAWEAAQVIGSAAAMMAGSMVVNALLPPPSLPSPQQASQLAAPSPTYNLQAQGNSARLGGAIPEQFGRLRCFPDFAAQPYIEYSDNEQYVFSLLCLGEGYYDIEAIQIEDTPIAGFAEIEYQIVNPGDPLTLFPANVVSNGEVSGQELLEGAYIGPFTANASGTLANYLSFDVVLPRGLYYAEDNGSLSDVSLTVKAEARPIDDNGDPVAPGTWTILGTETLTYKTTTPQRKSFRYGVGEARYQCRMTRTDTKQTDTRYGHEVLWSGLRAYLPETRDYGTVTLLALRMRASNNLSNLAARKVNVIATRKLPIWDGAEWSAPTTTTSIAWALAYMCKRVGLADSRIGLAELLTLDDTWSSRGDQFNGRFDATMTLWEALGKVALAGRAKNYMQGGVVRTVRDQQQSIPVALFSMRNIVKGSFAIHYLMPTEDTADSIETTYFDRNYWSDRRVLSTLSGSTSANPGKVASFGVTDRAHAYRDGLYLAATNRYRRKIITFETEMEGFIPSLLDLIAIAHDMVEWGQTAEAVTWNENALTLTLSEPLTWTAGQTHYIGLRNASGGLEGPYAVTQGADEYQVVFPQSPSTPYTGLDAERTHVAFGPGETWRQPAKVVAVRPKGLYRVQIEAINEDVSVHNAESGMTAPAVQYSQLPNLFTSPVITNLSLRPSSYDPNKALLSWTPAPGADSYQIEAAAGYDSEDPSLIWTRLGETTANSYAVTALYEVQTLLRVRAVGMTVGPWVIGFFGSLRWGNIAGETTTWNQVPVTDTWASILGL